MGRTTAHCAACGAALSGPFCSSCGAPAGAGSPGAPPRGPARSTFPPWMILAAAAVVLGGALLLVVRRERAARPDAAAAVPAGAPPDISAMPPRERFDRLYNRTMRAAESGDTATVRTFAPMALLAYGQLETVDADARYHAALIRLHTGDAAGASALADTILTGQPGHLFGYIVRSTVARWQGDSAAMRTAYSGFLRHYDAEMKAARPEYDDHKFIIDDVHRLATAPRTAARGVARRD